MTREYSNEEIEFMKNVLAENMTEEEGYYYYHLLQNCKDIVNINSSKYSGYKGTIVHLYMDKNDNDNIKFNAVVSYKTDGSVSGINACIAGNITKSNNKIIVEMNFNFLCSDIEHNEYIVFDEFALKKGKVIRNSFYNYDITKKFKDEVEIEWRKNRL